VWVEQAIFTSLPRHGRGGYHLVSRSRGIPEGDAQAIARWAPSHGGLLLDQKNRISVNFHPLPSGRYALSRSCEGPPEYSGRGGRQVYTHILVLDEPCLAAIDWQIFEIYHNALALGLLFYQVNPPSKLESINLPGFHRGFAPEVWRTRAIESGLPDLEPLRERLESGRAVRFGYDGDRTSLIEYLVGSLSAEVLFRISFTSSLQPSAVRPFVLSLVDNALARRP
jgi:hypothetical protein